MNSKRIGNTLVVRLDPGEEICESLLKVAEKEQITGGSVSGIGATDRFTVGVFDLAKKGYEAFEFGGSNYEITSLIGNLSLMNGKPYQHLHITCAGKGGAIVGGHLIKAVISLTSEIYVQIAEGTVNRSRNETLGINTLEL